MSKKVLFAISCLKIGGSEKKTVSIANTLSGKGYEVHLVYMNPPDTLAATLLEGIHVANMNRRFRIDIGATSRYRKAVYDSGAPIVIAINLYPMLVHRMAMFGNKNKPVLFVSINSTFLSKKEKWQMLIYKGLLRSDSQLIFGSSRQRDFWVSKYNLPKDRTRVIYNGVNTEYFSPQYGVHKRIETRQYHGIDTDEIVIGMVAAFRPEKRNIDLLRAASTLLSLGYKIRLLLVGDGPSLSQCVKESELLGIRSKSVFLGAVHDVRPALAAMDIFVLCSETETFSNAALEAMAMSKPVIMTDVGGAAEMVQNGRNGFLYPPMDIDALIDRIRNTIDNNLSLELSNQGRKVVEQAFSSEKMIIEYERLLMAVSQENALFAA